MKDKKYQIISKMPIDEIVKTTLFLNGAFKYLESFGDIVDEERPNVERSYSEVLRMFTSFEQLEFWYDVLDDEMNYFEVDKDMIVHVLPFFYQQAQNISL